MPRPGLALALVLHALLAGAYAWLTPSFEGPDENSHYEYAWHLANARQLPIPPALAAARGLPQTDGVVLAHHPPLYYALLAVVLRVAGADDTVFGPLENPAFGDPAAPSRHLHFRHAQGPPGVLLLLRAVSVLLGALSLVLLHRLGRVCCPDAPRVADLAVLLAACLPMWSFLHGVLNNDALVITLATAVLLALVRLHQADRVHLGHGAAIGALLGLALLTKLTALFLAPLAAAAFAARWATDRRAGRAAIAPALLAFGSAAVLAGGWFLRNRSLYGDLLATNVHDAAFAPIPPELRWDWFVGGFLPAATSSLFGRFGWFSLPPPTALVWMGAATAALALAGLVRWRIDRQRSPLHGAWLLLAAPALVFAGTAFFNWKAAQPQARLLLPAAAPAAVLLALGLDRLSRGLPRRRWLAVLPPLAAMAVLLGWFRPAFAIALAPAPASHRALVGRIVRDASAPVIRWQIPAGEEFATPPVLRWTDPNAPPDTRYSLYAFDAAGRVHLATHEWTKGGLVIVGEEFALPEAAWSFLPPGRDLFLRLRRVPTASGQRAEELPASAPLRMRRR
jgi:4-amino-4-deoxy-L-arabinose transferase-like glycosyltransferase